MHKRSTRRFELLKLIREASKGRGAMFRDLMAKFGLSHENACDHLKRLWRLRLIEPTENRPMGFNNGLQKGESIMFLRFRLTPRGDERLRWLEFNGR